MSNEQSRVAFFQAQPEGPGPFSRLTALSVVYLAWLNCSPSAWLGEKMNPGSNDPNGVNRP
jgi:hypothetical protein